MDRVGKNLSEIKEFLEGNIRAYASKNMGCPTLVLPTFPTTTKVQDKLINLFIHLVLSQVETLVSINIVNLLRRV